MKVIILFAIVFLVSCEYRFKKPPIQREDENSTVRSKLRSFSLLDCDSITNERSFVFFKEQRWDTSFLLVLRKTEDGAEGVYHEITPSNMESAYLVDVIFFNGFRFWTDSSTWNRVIHKSRALLDTVTHKQFDDCTDCGLYIVSHAGIFTYNGENVTQFAEYESFLRREVLAPVEMKRRRLKNGRVTDQ